MRQERLAGNDSIYAIAGDGAIITISMDPLSGQVSDTVRFSPFMRAKQGTLFIEFGSFTLEDEGELFVEFPCYGPLQDPAGSFIAEEKKVSLTKDHCQLILGQVASRTSAMIVRISRSLSAQIEAGR